MNHRYPLAGEVKPHRVPPGAHRNRVPQLVRLIVGIVLGMGLLGLFMRVVGG